MYQIDDQQIKEAVKIAKLLSHPVRVIILTLLKNNECTVSQLVDKLDLDQSAISHQIQLLKEENLLSARREGKQIFYKLDDSHILETLQGILDHANHVIKIKEQK
ncbi:MAG: metalloregulator ArsR/SmtB family transcription factor [Lactobacillaceae bacterium]|jgi:DNA-binding transcriptional ArsR family regulator|nr:metalloregulator ArsR/SmtB family transcription factor [Lactobacillaceae bacterium]